MKSYNDRGDLGDLWDMYEIRNLQIDKRYHGNYPKTIEEWKSLATEWKDELNHIIARYTSYDNTDIQVYLDNENLEEIYKLLSESWWNAPDSICIHSNPGWDALCDLCSEYSSCE